ncbi:P22AR C-terminal domain-containing protein [Glaesserella parasuis]|uniref:P22AR C-terminal domain-containing protein n=1 Tax=Glaesserella parasuis TaxID=738 RepID=UPI002436B6C4|nr:P22AR C-terminal domain-containing protein [Glaesserella parasuis]MDG6277006.1 P22AR C-terminal domain-containing protein [Glaesserella parasuis]
MSNLQILSKSIRTFGNLHCLNDCHQASGNLQKHKPVLFLRLDSTKELIEEIQKEDPTTQPLKTLRGTQGGTYACEELALAYAMWISPKFHFVVLRAFLAMHKQQNQQPKQIALPEPEKKYTFEFTEYELEQLTWLSFSHKQMNDLLGLLIQPLEALGSRYSASVYSHHHEYKRHYTESLDTIKRLTEPFKKSDRLNWKRVIHRLTA